MGQSRPLAPFSKAAQKIKILNLFLDMVLEEREIDGLMNLALRVWCIFLQKRDVYAKQSEHL